MKKIIFVKAHGTMDDAKKYMYNVAHRLEELGVQRIKCWSLSLVLETPHVKCRFISGDDFFIRPQQYQGLTGDEFFWFGDYGMLYVRRKDNGTEPYKGSVLDYIVEMEKEAVENGGQND